jgi:hypothetical protein
VRSRYPSQHLRAGTISEFPANTRKGTLDVAPVLGPKLLGRHKKPPDSEPFHGGDNISEDEDPVVGCKRVRRREDLQPSSGTLDGADTILLISDTD